MEQKKTSRPVSKTFIPTIDPEILARINAKIAKAHEQNEKPYVYQRPKKVADPKAAAKAVDPKTASNAVDTKTASKEL